MPFRSHSATTVSSRSQLLAEATAVTGGHQSLVKTMIRRLETALDHHDLADHLVLLSGPSHPPASPKPERKPISFVVGYSGSAPSQVALDLALCMAHQTRLVKPNPVIVHVVYVVDQTCPQAIAQADHILWQARCLASEWRGSLDAHLRVGAVATELSQVATEVEADVMVLGCHNANHSLVQALHPRSPCSILGIAL